MVEFSPWHLFLAYVLDLVVGDPRWMPHPVRWIGRLILFLEKILYPNAGISNPLGLILRGGILVVATISLVVASYIVVVMLIPRILQDFFIIWLTSTLIATRSLHEETSSVIDSLKERNLDKARKKLSWLVSRDTKYLDERGVLRATVETLSENISDGIIAPLFYIGVGGPLFGLVYKTVNTLDSMVGYKNERYFYFGKIAARFDDILNYIPARLSGALIIASSWILQKFQYSLNWKMGLKIMQRDGRLLESPNAGIPQAAMAGVLGITLGGPASYFGKTVNKPVIGDAICPFNIDSYNKAVVILYLSSFTGLILAMLLRSITGLC